MNSPKIERGNCKFCNQMLSGKRSEYFDTVILVCQHCDCHYYFDNYVCNFYYKYYHRNSQTYRLTFDIKNNLFIIDKSNKVWCEVLNLDHIPHITLENIDHKMDTMLVFL